MSRRYIICGTRDAKVVPQDVADALGLYKPYELGIVFVHGGSGNADLAAHLAAMDLWYSYTHDVDGAFPDYHCPLPEVHPAAWGSLGRRAGPVRNERMAKAGADLCLAFWDGRSRGTADMIARATRHRIPVKIVPVETGAPVAQEGDFLDRDGYVAVADGLREIRWY